MRKLMAALGIVAMTITMMAIMASPMWNGNRVLAAAPRPVTTAVSQPGAVRLEWTEPATDNLAGYVIRRGTGSGEEDRWPINDFPVVGTSYVDRNVTPGVTYYYTVFPLLTDGTLARGSFEVSATAGEIPDGYRLAPIQTDLPETSQLIVNGGKPVALHDRAIIHQGRVMLPLDDLRTLLGAKISYNSETGEILHMLPSGRQLEMQVGRPSLKFRLAERKDICSPVRQDGVIYLPLRWVVESMEGTVTFDTRNDRVIITMQPDAE